MLDLFVTKKLCKIMVDAIVDTEYHPGPFCSKKGRSITTVIIAFLKFKNVFDYKLTTGQVDEIILNLLYDASSQLLDQNGEIIYIKPFYVALYTADFFVNRGMLDRLEISHFALYENLNSEYSNPEIERLNKKIDEIKELYEL